MRCIGQIVNLFGNRLRRNYVIKPENHYTLLIPLRPYAAKAIGMYPLYSGGVLNAGERAQRGNIANWRMTQTMAAHITPNSRFHSSPLNIILTLKKINQSLL